MCYALFYLGLGVVQKHRAEVFAHELALQREHTPNRLGVKPSFANLVLWKSVYEYDGRYYVDAIHVAVSHKVYTGTQVDKLELNRHFPWLDMKSQQANDVERFRWFSNQHLGMDPNNPNRIIDVRYSVIPNQVTGMWGIELSPEALDNEHVKWTTNRPKGAAARARFAELWAMILGR